MVIEQWVASPIPSEGRSVVREGQVVIDCLGNMNIVDRIVLRLEELGDPVGGGSGVVTTDGDQELYVILLEKRKVEILLKVLVSRLETAHLEVGTTPVEISVSLEEIDVLDAGIFVEQSAVAFMESDDSEAFIKESLGD